MHRSILMMLFVITLMACTPYKILTTSQSTDHRSVERTIDTITKVVADSSVIRALLECDSLGRVKIAKLTQQNSSLQSQFFELLDNQITFKNTSQSEVRIREVVKTDTVYQTREIPVVHTVEKEVNRLTWWQKWAIWIALFYIARTTLKVAFNWRQITISKLIKLL